MVRTSYGSLYRLATNKSYRNGIPRDFHDTKRVNLEEGKSDRIMVQSISYKVAFT